MVAVDVVLGCQKEEVRPDVVVSIVDASNLDRNLYLTTQALELGLPVVVALNMVDVAESQGIRIDAGRLSRQLGVPVVPIQANKGKGLDALRAAIAGAVLEHIPAKGPSFPEAFEREVERSVRPSARTRRTFWCAGCCSTWAATPKSGSWTVSAPTAPKP